MIEPAPAEGEASPADPHLTPDPATAESGGIAQLAAAARRVVDTVVHADPPGNAALLAAKLHAIADEIAGTGRTAPPRWDNPEHNRDHNPVTGTANPIAPPLTVSADGAGGVVGTATLGFPYQGPPGHVHGGISALLLDHVLGIANAGAGHRAMTAWLRVSYHRPLPLLTECTVRGKQVSSEGRKIRATGTISTGEGSHVSAEGLFIAARQSR
ncbi:PaaI family thioesterase [Saccharomonospora sp. NPDC006951]